MEAVELLLSKGACIHLTDKVRAADKLIALGEMQMWVSHSQPGRCLSAREGSASRSSLGLCLSDTTLEYIRTSRGLCTDCLVHMLSALSFVASV